MLLFQHRVTYHPSATVLPLPHSAAVPTAGRTCYLRSMMPAARSRLPTSACAMSQTSRRPPTAVHLPCICTASCRAAHGRTAALRSSKKRRVTMKSRTSGASGFGPAGVRRYHCQWWHSVALAGSETARAPMTHSRQLLWLLSYKFAGVGRAPGPGLVRKRFTRGLISFAPGLPLIHCQLASPPAGVETAGGRDDSDQMISKAGVGRTAIPS